MIIKSQVFDDEALPPDLRHRESQIQQVIRLLHRTREERQGVLVTGPSGVGKTVLGRMVLSQYAHERDIEWTWIQTLGLTTGDVFREAIRGAGQEVADNAPNADLPRRLREATDGTHVLLLDEGDDLAGTGTVSKVASVPGIEVVIIVHNPDDWLARAESDVRQRLHGGRVALSRYGVDELADILADRARVGLIDGAVERDQLQTIADGVAGVARDGIQTLRAAAEIAEECEHDSIQKADIESAYGRARSRIRRTNLSSLPFHHLVLYEVIREAGEVTGEGLHSWYEAIEAQVYADQTRTPISRRARRNKLEKLQAYDLIERYKRDHRWVYRVIDDSLSSRVRLPDQHIQSA